MNTDEINFNLKNTPLTIKLFLGISTLTILLLNLLQALSGRLVVFRDGKEYFVFAEQLNQYLLQGDISAFMNTPVVGHWGTVIIGTIPLFFEIPNVTPRQLFAVFFTLPAVINIYLVFNLALKIRFSHRAALFSAILFALSFTNMYHVRHVMPNNLAITFFLLSLILTLSDNSRQKPTYLIPLTAGFLSFLCFFTYYGYWIITGLALLFTCVYKTPSTTIFLKKVFFSAVGFFAPLFGFILFGKFHGANIIQHFLEFSQTITMGEYSKGLTLPPQFLFFSEGPLLFVWIACLSAGAYSWFKNTAPISIKALIGAILFIYIAFFISCNILELFVVYGRLVQQAIPFLCLVSGFYLANVDYRLFIAAIFVIAVHYMHNYNQLLHAVFEHEIDSIYERLNEENKNENREIIKADIYSSSFYKIEKQDYSHCNKIFSGVPNKTLKFFQYDHISKKAERALINNFETIEHTIIDCPINHPKNPTKEEASLVLFFYKNLYVEPAEAL